MSISAREMDQISNQNNNVRPFGIRDKFGYLFGDFGNDFFFILVAAYLMVYYTDVLHINASIVGALFMIARIWDAFVDVAWGRFIDTRPATKNGKFRPWIIRMSLPLVITGVLMFVKIPGMSQGFYLAWAIVTYIVWGSLYSTVNIPYGSMASVITNDPIERTSLSSWRAMGAALAGFIINVIGPIILFVNNEAVASRFLMAAIIFGVLSIACYLACYTMTTERIQVPERSQEDKNFGKTIKSLVKNKPLIWVLVSSLFFIIVQLLISSVNVYLFKDYFQTTTALSVAGAIQTGMAFLAMPLVNPLVRRHGKKELAAGAMVMSGIAYLLLYFMPNVTLPLFLALIGVVFFGMAFFQFVVYAFVTDVVDYHEYKTGLREDGTVYSIYSFARKLGQAVAGGIGAFAIAAVGYVETAKFQSEDTLSGLYTLATLVPGILFLIVAAVLAFLYPLNKQRTLELAEILSKKRNIIRP